MKAQSWSGRNEVSWWPQSLFQASAKSLGRGSDR